MDRSGYGKAYSDGLWVGASNGIGETVYLILGIIDVLYM